jgi:hypothetical protein
VAGLQTEYSFTLPKGYIDGEGNLHRHGSMRLATARDEIEPLRDANINSVDDPYLTILVLSRVITELGTLARVTPHDVENFFAADLAFLQDLYGIINFGDPADVEALQQAVVRDEVVAPPAAPPASEPIDLPTGNSAVDTGQFEDVAPRRQRDRIEEIERHAER